MSNFNKYMASKVAKAIDTLELRNSKEFKKEDFRIHDETMSCDLEEAISWMVHYMKEALMEGKNTKDNRLRAQFLAAFDIWKGLTGRDDIELGVWRW